MAYHNKRNRFDKDLYDPMQLGATVKEITEGNGMIPDWFDDGTEEWEDLLEFAKDAAEAKVAMPKDAPAKIKAAYDNYYAQKNKKKSSTRDKVVAKVKKSRSK